MTPTRTLYVETLIRCELDELWRLTQEPRLHQRWDLRFTQIEYCPPVGPAGPRQFRYVVRLLPGLQVSGTGVCAGERTRPDGTRTSALRFGSEQGLSLIRSGAGYWRYVPVPDGIRFLTGYDYLPGWGGAGQLIDRLFRPMLGWATAWSFDRLRLWLEDGQPPERSLRLALFAAWLRTGVGICAWLVLPLPAAALVSAAVVLARPPHRVPSARRCLRRPPDRRSGTPPSALAALPPLAMEPSPAISSGSTHELDLPARPGR